MTFADEAQRLWESGADWPLTAGMMSARAARPAFSEEFGPELTEVLDAAGEVLITGVARNAFLNSQFGKVEARLRAGQAVRFLLVDPSTPAVDVVAQRYYAERSADTVRGTHPREPAVARRTQTADRGDLSVRLTSHPLSTGVIAVDGESIYAEYCSYQAAGEPKFVLHPGDGFGHRALLGEAKALWVSAAPYDLG